MIERNEYDEELKEVLLLNRGKIKWIGSQNESGMREAYIG